MDLEVLTLFQFNDGPTYVAAKSLDEALLIWSVDEKGRKRDATSVRAVGSVYVKGKTK